MTDEHLPFLQSVIASPADDLPRLVYADWLMEHGGDARAEFIRVQCRLSATYDDDSRDGKGKWKLEDGASLDEYRALRRRERELLGENISTDGRSVRPRYYEWCEQAGINPMWVLTPGFTVGLGQRAADHFRRGFVEEITCSWADCEAHLDAIRGRTPLRKVRLRTTPDAETFHSPNGDGRWVCPRRWPGVEFQLPPYADGAIHHDTTTGRVDVMRGGAWQSLSPEQSLALGDASLGVTQGGN